MKKKLFLFSAALLCLLSVHAQNAVGVPSVTIPQGRTGVISVQLNNDKEYTAFTLKLNLPTGISVVANSETKGARMATSHSLSVSGTTGSVGVGCLSTANALFSGTNGELFAITVSADAGLAVGEVLDASITEARFSTTSGDELLNDVNFTITIAEPRIVFDETSTTAPVDANGENVLVRRTIKANDWSTICLPFDMTEAQVKAAFGDDVQLADFTSWSSDEDDGGDIVGINVGFTAISAIGANHPCLIKVSSPVTEFTVDNVDIVVEDEPTVQVGKKKVEKGFLTGTYVANTTVPENNLFLSGNMFYYSKGLTKMKAFRAYFEFYDILTAVENASAKVRFSIDDEATYIEGLTDKQSLDGVYTIQGQFVGNDVELNRLPKGVYIVNGKKVVKQ